MDWYLKALKNYIGFGGRARRKEYWMFILVNLILTGGRRRHSDDHLWRTGLFTVVGGAVSASARHRPLSLVAAAAVDPGHRLAGDPDL